MSQSHEKQLVEALRGILATGDDGTSLERDEKILKAIKEELAPLVELAATIKARPRGAGPGAPLETDRAQSARWVCEQAHQQLKEELGLDHFEGRSWTGLHRHALMTMIAFAFLQHLRLEQAGGRGKKQPSSGRTPAATHAAGGPAHAAGAALACGRLLPPLWCSSQTGVA